MDKLHKEVATERYEMLIRHAIKEPKISHDTLGHKLIFGMIDSGRDGYFLFEVRCFTCGWWDHWDERKSDWV